MVIHKAEIQDHETLTLITRRSKSYWGYPEELLSSWSDVLTITKHYIEQDYVFKLVDQEKIVGYYSYIDEGNRTVLLDNLFVLPEYIGQGLGRQLMDHFFERMRSGSYHRIRLEADPNAESFYSKFGFRKIGESPTSIKERFLPIMEFIL